MNDILSHLEDAESFFNSFILPPKLSLENHMQTTSITLFDGIGNIQAVEKGTKAIITCTTPQDSASSDISTYDAVLYETNFIAVSKKTTKFGLSFDFTGCLMAQFTVEGQKYIAHISTTSSKEEFDCKNEFVWFLNIVNYLKGPVHDVVLFKPDSDFNDFDGSPPYDAVGSAYGKACSSWGVIDDDNQCYILSVAKDGKDIYRLFAVKKITKPLSTSLFELRWATLTGWNFYLKRQKVDLLWKFK